MRDTEGLDQGSGKDEEKGWSIWETERRKSAGLGEGLVMRRSWAAHHEELPEEAYGTCAEGIRS